MFLDHYLNENAQPSNDGPKLDEFGLLTAVLEAEETLNEYTIALIKAEHESIVSENAQILQEASVDWVNKVKKFFADLWEAVKRFGRWVWAQITSVFMKRDTWVRKYKDEITKGGQKAANSKANWNVKKKTHAFNNLSLPSVSDIRNAISKNDIESITAAYHKAKNVVNDDNVKVSLIGTRISSYVSEALDFVLHTNMKDFKKMTDDLMKAVRTARDSAVKAAKDSKDSTTVTKERKLASMKVRTVQVYYRGMSAAYNYAYSICKKAYSYNTFKKD